MAVFGEAHQHRYPLRAVATRSLFVWSVALALLGLGFWLLERNQSAQLERMIAAEERALVDRGTGILAVELNHPLSDLPYVAELPALRDWLQGGSDVGLERVGDVFLTLARHRPHYVKIRLFDARGVELVRVNQGAAGVELVPGAALQDKSTRYFVHDGLALPAGAIHVSRLDLNVEQGVIEQPLRPMLRLGTPVAGPDGQPRGLVTINYLGQHLLDRLAALAPYTRGPGLWLLDADGNWLAGERPEDAWAFEFGADGQRFQDRYGAVWAAFDRVQPGETGQVRVGGDLFTWRRLVPAAPNADRVLRGPGAGGWILVSRLPQQTLVAAGTATRRPLGAWLVILALAALAASAALAHYQVRRRQHLAQVEASEARFQKLLESAPDAIVIVDAGGRIRLANARVSDWFGYQSSELLGRPVEALIPEPLRLRHRQHRSAYLMAPRARTMGIGTQLAARRSDGSEFPVEISLSPIATAEGDLVIAVVRDITERRRLEQAREEAQARYRRLLDNLPLGIFRSSMSERLADDRRFLEVNPALVAMFEAGNAERLLACDLPRLYHDDGERVALIAELFALGEVVGRELRMVTLNGRVFDARLFAVLRRDAAGNRFVDGVIEDVSSRRAAERDRDHAHEELQHRAAALEVANRELDAFSYSVSHDLRAPLRAMDGFSRILEQEYGAQLDERGRDYLVRVRNAARHMAALIDDLLKLSRVTRTELRPEPIDLSLLAQELLTELQHDDPQRSVDCTIQPELRARGDARLLRVALANLLGNAWKFTTRTVGAVIEFGAREQEGERVFYVRDNGVGFDMAYADKLFGAFQRLHHAQDFSGTGIGLATAQRVILKHGGHIWAEAAVGVGAVFYFTLEATSTAPGERIAGNRAFDTAREADPLREIS